MARWGKWKRSRPLTANEAKEIQLRERQGIKRDELAFEYNVTRHCVDKVCQGRYKVQK